MAGLTSSDIAGRLAAAAVGTAAQALVVRFLNEAPDAVALAGDGSDGTGLGPALARALVAQRKALGGFTDLKQLAGVKGLTAARLDELLAVFVRAVNEVSAIVFDIHPGAIAGEGLSLRRNFATALVPRAWRAGLPSTPADAPAAYAIRETQGNPLAIRAAFRANGLSAAYVRATGGGPLGTVKAQLVSFDAAGESGLQTFEIENPTFHAAGVGAHDVSWQWQWRRRAADPWRNLVVSRHRVYAVLEAPTLPWVQTAGSTALPWTDALEIACTWATGATGRDDAAGRVTARYNASGRVQYDTVRGATFYGFTAYHLTQMIDRLNGGPGLGGKVNCTDSANTVSTFANLLGCDLWQSRMESPGGFDLNPMIAIGHAAWAIPFSGRFSYHEVAWTGACTQDDFIFDGCLQFDGDADPANPPHTALLPANMLFGDCSALDYRLRLSPPTPAGCARCLPAPQTARMRRPID